MSRSYHKSNTMEHAYINWVCYSSNKKDKQVCNRLLRRISKLKLKKAITTDNLDNYLGYNKPREVRDVWDFNSDGLRHFFSFKHCPWVSKYTEEDIKKYIRK